MDCQSPQHRKCEFAETTSRKTLETERRPGVRPAQEVSAYRRRTFEARSTLTSWAGLTPGLPNWRDCEFVDLRHLLMVSEKRHSPTEIDVKSVIEMAWKDSVSFRDIEEAWGLSETRVVEIMRRELDESAYRRWRRRADRVASRRRKDRRG